MYQSARGERYVEYHDGSISNLAGREQWGAIVLVLDQRNCVLSRESYEFVHHPLLDDSLSTAT